jgi:hypothetical protein
VVYLNGVEIARSNMPGTPGENDIFYDTQPPNCSDDGSIFYSYLASPALLNAYADNVVAVEVHQQSPTSSDISFNLKLSATSPASDPSAVELTRSTCVKARVLDGGTWSALNEAVFAVGPVVENLRITEIMYNPSDPNAEYVELKNIGVDPINIGLVSFTDGIDFTFPSQELAAGD